MTSLDSQSTFSISRPDYARVRKISRIYCSMMRYCAPSIFDSTLLTAPEHPLQVMATLYLYVCPCDSWYDMQLLSLCVCDNRSHHSHSCCSCTLGESVVVQVLYADGASQRLSQLVAKEALCGTRGERPCFRFSQLRVLLSRAYSLLQRRSRNVRLTLLTTVRRDGMSIWHLNDTCARDR